MINLEDIIKYENECTYLDFKKSQYKREVFRDLLVDIMSLANAATTEDRYIIVGVKLNPDGSRNFVGINENLTDAATYQQLVNSNIEPELHLDYFSYDFEGKKIGIFRLTNCNNPPYMMRKAYQNLNQGDSYIRKGSHQVRLARIDIERIISNRVANTHFAGETVIYFEPSKLDIFELSPIINLALPSNNAIKKIDKILKERERAEIDGRLSSIIANQNIRMFSPFASRNYEQRSSEELKKSLANIKKDYKDQDNYYLYEQISTKINLGLLNKGTSYIEDASVFVKIEKMDGIIVSNQIYHEPRRASDLTSAIFSEPSSWEDMNYPNIISDGKVYTIEGYKGDIKHNLHTNIFEVPIRVLCGPELIGREITVQVDVHAKNLASPISKTLKILVKAPAQH